MNGGAITKFQKWLIWLNSCTIFDKVPLENWALRREVVLSADFCNGH